MLKFTILAKSKIWQPTLLQININNMKFINEFPEGTQCSSAEGFMKVLTNVGIKPLLTYFKLILLTQNLLNFFFFV